MTRAFMSMMALAALLVPAAAGYADSDAKSNTDTAHILFQPSFQYPAQGGPGAKVAFLPVGSVLLVGGSGELMLNDTLSIGVVSYSLSSEVTPTYGGVKHDLGFSYGGMTLGTSFYPKRLFYFNANCVVGLGQAWTVARQNNANRTYTDFFIFEPEMNWMVNVTPELRVGLGLSWRVLAGGDVSQNMGLDLGGAAATFSLMYGKI